MRRRLKVACLTAVVGGSLTLLVYSNDWEVSTIGAIRFGRAAWAVSFLFPCSIIDQYIYIYSMSLHVFSCQILST